MKVCFLFVVAVGAGFTSFASAEVLPRIALSEVSEPYRAVKDAATCAPGCNLVFGPVPAGKVLIINTISCNYSNSEVRFIGLNNGTIPLLYVPVDADGISVALSGVAVPFEAGERPQVLISATIGNPAKCALLGMLYRVKSAP